MQISGKGSADWKLESIWRTWRHDPERKTFALQYAPSSVPFEELPRWFVKPLSPR
jgi:hypothetical protein